jgi:predicted ATP-grasp superfamily ATP-dependent carboligase
VSAIDAFADIETSALADSSRVVEYDSQGFNAEALLRAVRAMNTGGFLGFVYGSGFEAQPALLQKIAAILPLLGNTAATVLAVKTAAVFFAGLRQHQIPFPAVIDNLAQMLPGQTYLKKFAAGCGGSHISYATAVDAARQTNHYYQQQLSGRAVSLLFIATWQGLEVIGFNEQWLCPATATPFRYGGAVSNTALAPEIKQQLVSAAQQLTAAFALIGLNSLDAIVHGDMVYVLEINPRLTATVDLYAHENLLQRHVLACQRASYSYEDLQADPNVRQSSTAHAVVYAQTAITIASAVDWPDWAVDIPSIVAGSELAVAAGDPVCSVIAISDNAESSKQLAQTRVKIMHELLH